MHYTSLDERVEKIRDCEEEINNLIEEYKPFIASCTEKVTGKYVRYGEDDELSIALIAFVEAIKAYDSSKGSFLSFAQNVIRRRLIDYFRKENRNSNVTYLNDYINDEGEQETDLSISQTINEYSSSLINEYRRLEIEELKVELSEWDISFVDLAKTSPKRKRTKKLYKEILQFVLSRPDLVEQLRKKKQLPVSEIEKYLKIPKKNVERARKYIIAAVIIMTGDYQYIKEYISWG
ncbi:MAG TPA: RNA polymerase sigma factor SigI [Clostridiaceae bacterium]|nr:RNA polymerase sigma factor SigI [Clostridiaceae bacterium]